MYNIENIISNKAKQNGISIDNYLSTLTFMYRLGKRVRVKERERERELKRKG